MAKERDDGREDDPLDDVNLDDVDLESLLKEVDAKDDAGEAGRTTELEPGKAGRAVDGGDEALELQESDLIPADDLPPEGSGAQDSSRSGGEKTEVIDVDANPAAVKFASSARDGRGEEGPSGEGRNEGGEGAGGEGAEAPRAAGTKKGKGKFPPRGGAAGKGAGRALKEPREARKERKIKTARPAAVRGGIRFVCSECYEEFILSSSYSKETVTCPECLHVGKRPDEDFLRTVNLHKSGERKSLTVTLVVGGVLLLELLFLVWLRSPYSGTSLTPDALHTWTLGLLGAGGLLTIIFLWLLTRFETNRWEVYF